MSVSPMRKPKHRPPVPNEILRKIRAEGGTANWRQLMAWFPHATQGDMVKALSLLRREQKVEHRGDDRWHLMENSHGAHSNAGPTP